MVAIKNNVPTRTCKPWKPVATKNVLPKEESEMVKGASTYSSSWINVKYTPNKIVIIRDWAVRDPLLPTKAFCSHVTLTPKENIIVFTKRVYSIKYLNRDRRSRGALIESTSEARTNLRNNFSTFTLNSS